MIAAAALRFAAIFVAAGLGSAALGALVALGTGAPVARGSAVGLYALGGLCTVIGAGLVIRSSVQQRAPHRPGPEPAPAAGGDRELAGVLIALGILLLVVGVAIDPRARLV